MPPADKVAVSKAPPLIVFAHTDKRIDSMRPPARPRYAAAAAAAKTACKRASALFNRTLRA